MLKNIVKLRFALFLALAAFSCKKVASSPDLNGTWELRSIAGGNVSATSSTLAPGNGNQLRFNQQNFERYVAGKRTDSGTFTIKAEKRKINNDEANYHIVTHGNMDEYIKLSKDSLVFFEGSIATDGIESHYVKL